MSLAFSNTSDLNGILQLIEKEVGFDYGFITGNTNRLKEWTAEVNLVHDFVVAKAIKAGGTWQFDDSNHTDFPFITADLKSNQRDYTFTTDEQGNIILDIYKVMVADASGNFSEIEPVDQQTRKSDTASFYDGNNSGGTPSRYDKTANGILLDYIPNYSYTKGIKAFINREGSYFTTNDTTKKPGVDGRIHEYYVVEPALKYALRHGLASAQGLQIRKAELEKLIDEVYCVRPRDESRRLVAAINESK